MSEVPTITVYGSHTIPLNKFPRKDAEHQKTDIMIIIFLMHEEYLKNIVKSHENALSYFNNCLEYFFPFYFENKKNNKTYSAQEIIQLVNQTDSFMKLNRHFEIQKRFLQRMDHLDAVFYIYLKNRFFFSSFFQAIVDAKNAYFQCREFFYTFSPPSDFYGRMPAQQYSALDLMEINAYAQQLIKMRIIKELPKPLFLDN